MCNEAARLRALNEISAAFSQLRIPLTFPEGAPNLPAAASIRITDPAAIVRFRDTTAELVQRRWSWAGAHGARSGAAARSGAGSAAAARSGGPVYNFRSEGRSFVNSGSGGRCLIPLDGFYEFTAAEPPAKRKTKWLFTLAPGADGTDPDDARPLFAVAGLWRAGVVAGGPGGAAGAAGEAFTMLTCAPGPDIAPYHSRQIVLMPRDRWADWLAGAVPAADLIAPTPAGTLRVERVG
ncbi:MAG: SOS response-associated peptidase family protein [Sphingomonadaceae bacterium]|nr:SOS response-associated peptidase family protein [Sphingomonadaceae bacterium]